MKRNALIVLLPVLLFVLNGFSEPIPIARSGPQELSPLEDLGRYLFFDPRLSGDGSLSCASCHNPEYGWTDGQQLSRAYPGSDGFRNTKSTLNISDTKHLYWDGRLPGSDLETQVRDAITETHFMNLDGRLMQERLKQVPEYIQMFEIALSSEPSFGGTLKAIAAFEKTLRTGPSPYDTDNLSDAAKRGQLIFEGKGACSSCHSGATFTDHAPHRTGVPENPSILGMPLRHATYRSFIKAMGVPGYMQAKTDVGYFTVTKSSKDLGAFITPVLKQVADTGPYMHNGMFSTLEEVVSFYDKRGDGLALTEVEKADLVTFLESLSGPLPEVEVPQLPAYQLINNWNEARN